MVDLRAYPPNARLTGHYADELKHFKRGDIQAEWEDVLPRKHRIELGTKPLDIHRIIQQSSSVKGNVLTP